MYCSALALLCAIVFGHALTNEPTVEQNLEVVTYDDRNANTTKGQLFKRGIFAYIYIYCSCYTFQRKFFITFDLFVALSIISNMAIYITDTCDGASSNYWDCCSGDQPCSEGEGDCDFDSDCAGLLFCGSDNCLIYHSSLESLWESSADCCTSVSK